MLYTIFFSLSCTSITFNRDFDLPLRYQDKNGVLQIEKIQHFSKSSSINISLPPVQNISDKDSWKDCEQCVFKSYVDQEGKKNKNYFVPVQLNGKNYWVSFSYLLAKNIISISDSSHYCSTCTITDGQAEEVSSGNTKLIRDPIFLSHPCSSLQVDPVKYSNIDRSIFYQCLTSIVKKINKKKNYRHRLQEMNRLPLHQKRLIAMILTTLGEVSNQESQSQMGDFLMIMKIIDNRVRKGNKQKYSISELDVVLQNKQFSMYNDTVHRKGNVRTVTSAAQTWLNKIERGTSTAKVYKAIDAFKKFYSANMQLSSRGQKIDDRNFDHYYANYVHPNWRHRMKCHSNLTIGGYRINPIHIFCENNYRFTNRYLVKL